MPREKKPIEKHLTSPIYTRWTAAEKEELRKLAKAAGQSINSYIRVRCGFGAGRKAGKGETK